MPKGVYERQPNTVTGYDPDDQSMPLSTVGTIPEVLPVKMVAMKLLRHYRPAGAFDIVGYTKPEVSKKFPNGETKVVEPEEYIPGEQCPAPFPGVVSTGKIWANTTIKVPEDEGKIMKRLGIAERDFED